MKYTTASEYYKSVFGTKVYKISLDAGCTCPTRDGTKGYGGCIFCSASGSGDFAASRSLSIVEQVEQAKLLVNRKLMGRSKAEDRKYLAYFQNFTSTYGNPVKLIEKYQAALECKDVVGLCIATRPDCLEKEILQKIAELADIFYVSIELGFQTSNEKTAEFIHRGYDNSIYLDAVKRIHEANSKIHVVTHLIFGLPGDEEKDMLDSVSFVLAGGTDGIKFTVLHVLENTRLAELWRNGDIKTLSKDEYFLLLRKALEIIPENIVIHRLTGDGPKKLLLAPLWTGEKKKILNELGKFLKNH